LGNQLILKWRLLFLFIIFTSVSCVSVPLKTYEKTVSQWTTYEDVANWMRKYYSYDMAKARKYEGQYIPGHPLPPHPVKTPQQSFLEKKGMSFDAANFAKDALNRINPSYAAEVVYIENRPYFKPNHLVCSFRKDGELYILDYGVPKKSGRRGVFGPFINLDEYAAFYIIQHPKIIRISSISFGWPDYVKVRVPD
jgi:hypothetical protein